MTWEERSIMEQRKEFVLKSLKGQKPFRELCSEYGISEKTGYKWKKRFMEDGVKGLEDQSRRPHNSPSQISIDEAIEIINIRQVHPFWGPKKIQVILGKNKKISNIPSISSIKRILDKANLTKKRKCRRVDLENSPLHQLFSAESPNEVWCIDFKGYWYSNGEKIIPFTVRDLFSRKIIDIRAVQTASTESVRTALTNLFKEYGLPKVIRSDNGEPFASSSNPLGLTKLSAWLISLGIRPDRTKPGTPGQNGSLERMHADMARELEKQIPGGLSACQAAFDVWREEYNSVRPNEAIGMKTPDEIYTKSSRKYMGDPDVIEYPHFYFPRKIGHHGHVKIKGHSIFISRALDGHMVGLQPLSETDFIIWFAEFPLGIVHLDRDSFEYNLGDIPFPPLSP